MTIDGKSLMAQVKANRAKLQACSRPHDFSPVGGTFKLGGRQICSKCSGLVSNVDAMYYKEGLADAEKVHVESR